MLKPTLPIRRSGDLSPWIGIPMHSWMRNTKDTFARCHRPSVRLLQLVAFTMALFLPYTSTAAPDHAERAIKQRVAPIYPELAKRMRVAGVVKLQVTVAPDGSVTSLKTITGSQLLSPAAEDAVHKWKFVTAPQESTVEVEVNFALGN
jgi:TonB family protein